MLLPSARQRPAWHCLCAFERERDVALDLTLWNGRYWMRRLSRQRTVHSLSLPQSSNRAKRACLALAILLSTVMSIRVRRPRFCNVEGLQSRGCGKRVQLLSPTWRQQCETWPRHSTGFWHSLDRGVSALKEPALCGFSIWMPPVPVQVAFSQTHANSAKAIRDCAVRSQENPLPNTDACRLTLFAGAFVEFEAVWEALGGKFSSPPAVAAWGENRLDIFAIGVNKEMFHKAWTGSAWAPSPTDWEPLGGQFNSPPAVVAWGEVPPRHLRPRHGQSNVP